MGRRVRTLTGHQERAASANGDIKVRPLQFEDRAQLVESLRGAITLYNTYWVRFPCAGVTYERAVENSRVLIDGAVEAGVRNIVHISITNPSESSALGYFSGKAAVERAIAGSGLAYAILRPTVIFGVEDILINNIAWLLRHLPVFASPGPGDYRLQPVFVMDVAEMAVAAGQQAGNTTFDAVGPEAFAFQDMVRLIAVKLRSHTRLIHLPPALALGLTRLVGLAVRDVVLTRDEVQDLMDGLLVSSSTPTGRRRFSAWLDRHAHLLGTRYASELDRHYRS